MKKAFVVIVLFALPIVAYLFFASGVNNFAKLPVLNENVQELDGFESTSGEPLSFQKNISILGFFGEDPLSYSGNTYNLAEKIYDNYFKFKDFQVVIVVPEGTEEETAKLGAELERIVDPLKWKFVFASPEEIEKLFSSLETTHSLESDLSTPYVFIIDKKGRLRGRTDDEDTGDGMLYGYDTRSVAELDDKMDDDVKVILAEYRLELKKYNEDEKEQL